MKLTQTTPHLFRRRLLRTIGAALVFLLALAGGYLFWYTHRPLPEAISSQQLFQGITYTRDIRRDPRPMIVHIITIDLDAPGIGFLVTPGDPVDGYVYAAQTVAQFLDRYDVQVAINGDFFDPWHEHGPFDYYPHVGDGTNVRGFTASLGTVVFEGYVPNGSFHTLYISSDNHVSFDMPTGDIYNAISGDPLIVTGGQISVGGGDSYQHKPHPRTAVGLDESGSTLILVVVDGRQPNYSEGATLPELAAILIEHGAYTALNLDGGGSSTLVMEGEDGQSVQLGSAIHTRIPARERPIANHLGIYAKRVHQSE